MFYQLIYGSNETALWNGVIPASGNITCEFDVPNQGIEESNILINGNITNCEIKNPTGQTVNDVVTTKSNTITLKKIYHPEAGRWSVFVQGDPGTEVNVNLLFNYDYYIVDKTDLKDSYEIDDDLEVEACLYSDKDSNNPINELAEYSCDLVLVNVNGNKIAQEKLSLQNGVFKGSHKITSKQSFSYYVTASYISKDKYGSIEKSTKPRQVCVSNSKPISNGDKDITVYIWPFSKNTQCDIDMTSLAQDKEDDELRCEVKESSFVEKDDNGNGDYSVNEKIINQTGFSLWQGSYTIRSVDSGDLYCDTKVTVTAIDVGLVGLLIILFGGLIALVVMLILLRIALTKPSVGFLYVKSSPDADPVITYPWRGRRKLAYFQLQPSVLNYTKSYFQAEKDTFVTLHTDKPVYIYGQKVKEYKIQSSPTYLKIDTSNNPDDSFTFYVRFETKLRNSGSSYNKKGIRNVFYSISDFFSSIFRKKQPSGYYQPNYNTNNSRTKRGKVKYK